jgi:hypothetical protein
MTGPERAMAESIMRQQVDAFAKDPYAAGTALYPSVGPALPEDNVQGRLQQARMIEAMRGTTGFWVPLDAKNDTNVVLAQNTGPSAAPQPNANGGGSDGPPRRGTAVDPEPPPGNPEREAAEKGASPEIGGPFSGLSHWLFGNNEPRSYPFDKINTTSVAPEQFDDVQKILREGKPGTYQIDTKRGFWAGQDFDSRFLVGNITLRLEGELTVGEGGKYAFKGNLGALPDTYRMYSSNHRNSVDESATRAGELMGSLGHGDYQINITGQKPISSSGTFKAQP